jgi:tetrapyrrole methylase family protein/MazG family protein
MLSVARNLPELWRAEKIQKTAAKAGFDWPDYSGALVSLRSELIEFEESVASGDGVAEELGDILFSAVNLVRFFGMDPERILNQASDKFISRFARVEKAANVAGKRPEDMTLNEMEILYQQAKLEE